MDLISDVKFEQQKKKTAAINSIKKLEQKETQQASRKNYCYTTS